MRLALFLRKDESNNFMRKAQILFLDFDDTKNPLLAGGQAYATYEIAKRLAKKGYGVKVISSKFPGFKDRVESGIHYEHVGLVTKNIKLNNIIYILSLPMIIKKQSADIIFECFTAPISTLFSPLWTKIPVIGISTSFEAERFSTLYHLPFHVVEKFGSRFYRYFIAFSEGLSDKMNKYNKNVVVKMIPHGVSDEYLENETKLPQHILFLGRLDLHQKGIDLLLQAYKQQEEKIKYPLLLAGSGPDKNAILKLINNLDLNKRVQLVGVVTGKKKLDLISKAKCVVVPSRQESFCLVALEALASGIPVLSFNIPGLSWAKTPVIVKTKFGKVNLFGKKLVEICNEKRSKNMENARKKFADNFSWDSVANAYELFAKEVVSKEGGTLI